MKIYDRFWETYDSVEDELLNEERKWAKLWIAYFENVKIIPNSETFPFKIICLHAAWSTVKTDAGRTAVAEVLARAKTMYNGCI